jgi:hypothetical protein
VAESGLPGRTIFPRRPETPLSTSALLVNGRDQPRIDIDQGSAGAFVEVVVGVGELELDRGDLDETMTELAEDVHDAGRIERTKTLRAKACDERALGKYRWSRSAAFSVL